MGEIRSLRLVALLWPALALGQVSNQQALSEVGATHVRTAAEVTAGVTPTNYGYLPLLVLRYGADPTGVADSTTAINNAIAVAAVNCGTVIFPFGGTFATSGQINVTPCVTLSGYGATINYSGSVYALTTAATGTTINASVFGLTINRSSSSAGSMRLGSCYRCNIRDIRTTGVNSTTNVEILLDTNTTGTPAPNGSGLNTVFNTFDNIEIESQVGTGLKLIGTGASNVVTDNTFINFNLGGGGTNSGAWVYGIELNQWCDSNTWAGNTRLALGAPAGTASAIALALGDGAGGGVYAESFQELAVDTFGSPSTDNRQGIVATNTTVKYIVVNLFEYGPGNPNGALNITQLLSSFINQAPRGISNYQSIDVLGSVVGVGAAALNNIVLYAQNGGQSTGSPQYSIFAGTPCFNGGTPVTCDAVAAQPSMASSGSAYNVTNLNGVHALAGALGTNATATTVTSFLDDGQTVGTTNNYGFRSNLNSTSTGALAFFGSGTAASQMNGPWTFSPSGSVVPVTITAPSGQNSLNIIPATGTNAIVVTAGSGNAAQFNLKGNGNGGASGFLISQDASGNDNLNAQAGTFSINAGTGSVQIQTAGVNRLTFVNGGLGTLGTGGLQSGGTTFTLGAGTGGCSTSSTLTGGQQAGSFACTGTAGASTQIINLPTSSHGWACSASDVTSGVVWAQSSTASNNCKISGTLTTTSDVVVFQAMGY